MSTQKSLIEKACEIVGSQATLARLLNVSPAMVNQLVKGHRPVPVEHCLTIESATGGQITRQMLRPDDYEKIWGVPDASKSSEVDHLMAQAAQAGQTERRKVVSGSAPQAV